MNKDYKYGNSLKYKMIIIKHVQLVRYLINLTIIIKIMFRYFPLRVTRFPFDDRKKAGKFFISKIKYDSG